MPHSENITKPTLVSSTAGSTAGPDPFDLESLRLNPSFLETTGVKKLITTVPARRPSPQDFVRVHPSPKYRDNFAVVDLKEDREDYLVRPEIIPDLANEIIYKTIYTAINRQGVCFLWPVRYPSPDDRRNDWARSAREAAELAMTRKRPISPATVISPLPSKPALSRGMRARKRMDQPANCSNSAFSRSNTAWKRSPLRCALPSRHASPAISCGPIAKPIAGSGPGRMLRSIRPCWWA